MFLFLLFPLAATAAPLYHLPETEAERALDYMLKTNARVDYILARLDMKNHRHYFSAEAQRTYANWFTPALLKNVAAQETQRIKRDCGGFYDSETCGFTLDVLSCTPVSMDPPFVYATESETRTAAVISYAWPPHLDGIGTATYKLVKKGKYWQIDGIRCNYLDQAFNMPAR